jgi:hypothetical protein
MSQGTPINKIGGNSMNDDDSRLVDSILNDLNNKPVEQASTPPSMPPGISPQAGIPPQQVTPEQHKAMLAQRQQAMMQQQMMMQQQSMMNQNKKNISGESILEKLQGEWKGLLIIFVLCVVMNLDVIDNLFKMDGLTIFLTESGGLNVQATFIKAVSVVILYFIFNTFVPI